jgi:hypothetical protein
MNLGRFVIEAKEDTHRRGGGKGVDPGFSPGVGVAIARASQRIVGAGVSVWGRSGGALRCERGSSVCRVNMTW